ncbi:hypothetical protein [Amycolatopsis sp. NPDC051371]
MTRARYAPAGPVAASFPGAAAPGRVRGTAIHPTTGNARKTAEAKA